MEVTKKLLEKIFVAMDFGKASKNALHMAILLMIAANKPFFVVKRGVRALIRRILCPVDFSEASRRALKNAIHLLGRTPGESKEKALVKRQKQKFERFLQGFFSKILIGNRSSGVGNPIRKFLMQLRKQNSICS